MNGQRIPGSTVGDIKVFRYVGGVAVLPGVEAGDSSVADADGHLRRHVTVGDQRLTSSDTN